MTRSVHDQVGRGVCGLALAPGTACLATGSDDGTVRIWDLRMTQSFKSFIAHNACVKVSIVFIVVIIEIIHPPQQQQQQTTEAATEELDSETH